MRVLPEVPVAHAAAAADGCHMIRLLAMPVTRQGWAFPGGSSRNWLCARALTCCINHTIPCHSVPYHTGAHIDKSQMLTLAGGPHGGARGAFPTRDSRAPVGSHPSASGRRLRRTVLRSAPCCSPLRRDYNCSMLCYTSSCSIT